LTNLSQVIGVWVSLGTFAVFCGLSAFWLINVLFGQLTLVSSASLFTILENVQVSIALLIACIPEGLPLATSIAMAFSIDRLKQDNLQVKDLASLESAGLVTEVVTGKTGTLTGGYLTVQSAYACGVF